jgi:hypothetical protein
MSGMLTMTLPGEPEASRHEEAVPDTRAALLRGLRAGIAGVGWESMRSWGAHVAQYEAKIE